VGVVIYLLNLYSGERFLSHQKDSFRYQFIESGQSRSNDKKEGEGPINSSSQNEGQVAALLKAQIREHMAALKHANQVEKLRRQVKMATSLRGFKSADFVAYFNSVDQDEFNELSATLSSDGICFLNHIISQYASACVLEGIDSHSQGITDLSFRNTVQGVCTGREMAMNGSMPISVLRSLPDSTRIYAEPEIMLNSVLSFPQETLEYYLSKDCQFVPNSEYTARLCSEFYLKNSEDFSHRVSNAPIGPKRDFVISYMVKHLKNVDKEAAQAWTRVVQNSEIKQELNAFLEKE
jgi:hypothetical protein